MAVSVVEALSSFRIFEKRGASKALYEKDLRLESFEFPRFLISKRLDLFMNSE